MEIDEKENLDLRRARTGNMQASLLLNSSQYGLGSERIERDPDAERHAAQWQTNFTNRIREGLRRDANEKSKLASINVDAVSSSGSDSGEEGGSRAGTLERYFQDPQKVEYRDTLLSNVAFSPRERPGSARHNVTFTD